MEAKNFIHYSWSEFEADCTIIFEKLDALMKEKPLCVFAFPRGGLVLGVVLSHYYDIPLYIDFDEAVRHVDTQNNKQILVVDDISDTGKTFMSLNDYTSYTTISIFLKEGTKFVPNLFIRDCLHSDWVVFPWEVQNANP